MSSLPDEFGAIRTGKFIVFLGWFVILSLLTITVLARLFAYLLGSDPFVLFAPVWRTLWSNVFIGTAFILGLVIVLGLFLMGKRRRYRFLTNRLPAAMIITGLFAVYSLMFVSVYFWSYKQSMESNESFNNSLFGIALTLVPLVLPVLYIWSQVHKALNLEIRKAYDASHTFNDEYRRQFIQTHYSELLRSEDSIITDWQRKVAPMRMSLMEWLWDGAYPLDTDQLAAYHREQLFLVKLAKAQHGSSARRPGEHMKTNGSNPDVIIPETFDLNLIEQRLLQYRFDANALSAFVTGVLDRFKSWEHRRRMLELFKFQDLVVLYHGKKYSMRAAENELSLLDLELELKVKQKERDIAETEADIAEAKKRQKDAQAAHPRRQRDNPSAEAAKADMYEEGLKDVERRETYHVEVLRIRHRVREQFEMEKATALLRELDTFELDQEARIIRIKGHCQLSPEEKKESLRRAAQTYVKILDDFAARNGIT